MTEKSDKPWVLGDRWLIVVVLIITGLTLWNSRELLIPSSMNEGEKDEGFQPVSSRGFETYAGYGFTFKHPQGMSFREDNFGSASASTESGFVQGMISEDPLFAYMEVFWNETSAYQNTVRFTDRFFQSFENSPDEVTGGEHFNSTSESGRELCCRFFNVIDRGGTSFKGVLGSWRDDAAGRYYMVTYLSTENLDDHELTDYLETLINSVDVT
ncbi:hypothetical protein JXL21_11010 [Candidatus Bathyarchaeota archaeon]|nr:hypothetical protein [Candidatus Bathyarchaeota archaeon]